MKAAFTKIKFALKLKNKKKSDKSGQINFSSLLEDDDILSRFFSLHQVTRFGFSSPICVAAFDSVQKLLAVGCSNGNICVMGQVGIEKFLDAEDSRSAIKFLKFKQGEGLLLSISSANVFTGWNLVNGKKDFVVTLDHRITCFEVPCGTNYCFLGTDTGKVLIFDSDRGVQSVVEIQCQSQISSPVRLLILHPQIASMLLVGYNNRVIFLWDLITNGVSRKYVAADLVAPKGMSTNDISITDGSWKPDGTHFVVGFDNGQFSIWSRRYEKSLITRSCIGDGHQTENDPIFQVEWCISTKNKEFTCLFISGGSDSNDPMKFIRIIDLGSNLNDFKHFKSQQLLPLQDSDVNFFQLVPSHYAWGNQQLDPCAIIILTSKNNINAFELLSSSFPEIPLFNSFVLYNFSKIKSRNFYLNLSAMEWFQLIDFQLQYEEIHPKSLPLPMICGGIINSLKESYRISSTDIIEKLKSKSEGSIEQEVEEIDPLAIPDPPIELNDIMMILDEGNCLKFWDCGSSLRYLNALDVHIPDITSSFLFTSDMTLALVLNKSKIQLLRLSDRISSFSEEFSIENDHLVLTRPNVEMKLGFVPFLLLELKKDSDILSLEYVCRTGTLAFATTSGMICLINTSEFKILHTELNIALSKEVLLKFGTCKLKPRGHDSSNGHVSFLLVSSSKDLTCFHLWDDKNKIQSDKLNVSTFDEEISYMEVLDSDGNICTLTEIPTREVHETKESKKKKSFEQFDISQAQCFVILVSSSNIRVLEGVSDKIYSSYGLENGILIRKASVVNFMGQSILVCFLANGEVDVFSLPHLRFLFKSEIPDKFKDFEAFLSSDGRITLTKEKEMVQYSIFSFDVRRKNVCVELHDRQLNIEDRPMLDHLKSDNSQWLGTITKAFTGSDVCASSEEWKQETESVQSHLFKNSSNSNISIKKTDKKQNLELPEEPVIEIVEESKRKTESSNNAFLNAKNRLDERGERLQQLDSKFANLADQSKNFLDTIKEYNKKQQEKKWYEW